MSELKKYLHSLIRNADECEADQASLRIDLGLWCATLSVQRKNDIRKEGGCI